MCISKARADTLKVNSNATITKNFDCLKKEQPQQTSTTYIITQMSNNHPHNLKCFLGFLALTSVTALTPVVQAKPPIPTETLLNRSGLRIESSTIKPHQNTLKPSLETIKPNGGLNRHNGICPNGSCAKKTHETLTNHGTPLRHSTPGLKR